MKNITKLTLYLALLLNGAMIVAQTNKASYFYDNNGNRTRATVILMTQPPSGSSPISPTPKVEETLEIDQQHSLAITIFPNPTQGELRVELSGATLEQLSAPNNAIKVWDVKGSLLLSVKPISESNIVNLTSYENGIYIMQLFFNGKTMSYKIIKN